MSKKTVLGALMHASGNILTILAGLLSFPAFTRLLSTADYGLMSLLSTTTYLCIGFCKCGMQQALLRHWSSDAKANHVAFSTALFGVLAMACANTSIVLLLISAYLNTTHGETPLLLALVGGTIVFESLKSILLNKELALGHSGRYNIAKVVNKYITVLLAIALLMTLQRGADDVFRGMYAGAAIVFAWLYVSDAQFKAKPANFDLGVFKKMLRFGFPLLIAELIDQALAFSDRYFIAYFLGVTAVGHYASAYNFIFNVQSVMISSFSLTIAPAVVQKYRAEQDPGVQDFLEKSLKIYCAIGSAVALGLFSVGADTFILINFCPRGIVI